MAQICIRKALLDDAEEISNIWIVICAEQKYSTISRPFTPKQEREYLISLSAINRLIILRNFYELLTMNLNIFSCIR